MKDHILYRWDRVEAGTPDPSRDAKATELKTKIDEMFPKYKENISVSSVKVPITTKGRQVISNREYLSTSMGVGGHIIGFLVYKLGQENFPITYYTTFNSSQFAFRDAKHKKLFVIPGSSITKSKDKLYRIKDTSLDNTIKPCDGILKFYPLGSLMPEPNTNNAEVDFTGTGELDGYMISFGDEEPEEEEEEEEESPVYDPFIRRGGAGKTYRKDVGVPPNFSKFLDFLWGEDRVPKDIVFNEIEFDRCPVKAGKRLKTKRRNPKKTQKRR
jgi:hypothetical protein